MTKQVRNFYLLVFTQMFSLIGSRMSGLAIGIWVYNETGNTTPLLLVGALQMVPMMLGTSIAGVYADRMDRKALLVFSDAGQALATFALWISFSSGAFELWHLYLASLVGATFGMIQQPVNAALTSTMVPDEQRDSANTVRQLGEPAAGFIAPIITGLLYGALGVRGIIMVDIATFLIAVLVVILFVTIPRLKPDSESEAEKNSVWSDLHEAMGFLWRYRPILWMVTFATFINFALNGPIHLMTPYVLALTGSEAMVGIATGLANLGMIAGGIAFSMVSDKIRPRIYGMLGGVIFTALALAFLGVVRSSIMIGVASFLLIAAIPMINALAFSMLQLKTPPNMQGRVFAMVMQLSILATPLSLVITGQVVDTILEPAVGTRAWDSVAPIVGNVEGSGMGLYTLISGLVLAVATALFFGMSSVRTMEATLPDYHVEDEKDNIPSDDPPPVARQVATA